MYIPRSRTIISSSSLIFRYLCFPPTASVYSVNELLPSLTAPFTFGDHTLQLVNIFQRPADTAIPLTKRPDLLHRDHWIYGAQVKGKPIVVDLPHPTYVISKLSLAMLLESSIGFEMRLGSTGAVTSTSTLHSVKCCAGLSNSQPLHPPSHTRLLAEAERSSVSFATMTSPA